MWPGVTLAILSVIAAIFTWRQYRVTRRPDLRFLAVSSLVTAALVLLFCWFRFYR